MRAGIHLLVISKRVQIGNVVAPEVSAGHAKLPQSLLRCYELAFVKRAKRQASMKRTQLIKETKLSVPDSRHNIFSSGVGANEDLRRQR